MRSALLIKQNKISHTPTNDKLNLFSKENEDIQSRLSEFYFGRIGVRMLIGQYLALRGDILDHDRDCNTNNTNTNNTNSNINTNGNTNHTNNSNHNNSTVNDELSIDMDMDTDIDGDIDTANSNSGMSKVSDTNISNIGYENETSKHIGRST